jgi:hypothetical protein
MCTNTSAPSLPPIGALAASTADFLSKSVDQKIANLVDLRLRKRDQLEGLPVRLRRLVTAAIFEQPVLHNDMYRLLLSSSMDDAALETFLSEYYLASCKGFADVIGKASRHFEAPHVRGYLKSIYDEEHSPRPHYNMLEDFITGCGYRISEPTIAPDFVQRSLEGFTRNEPFALGYSLGVEIEADFQIALVGTALLPRFKELLAEDQWFNLHLSADGEEFHSQLCLDAIVASSFDDAAFDEVEAGFVAACRDTQEFMDRLAAKISAAPSTEPRRLSEKQP